MTNATLNKKQYAGIRTYGLRWGSRIGKPRRGSLLYKYIISLLLSIASVAVSAAVVRVDSVKNPASLWYDLGYPLSSDMSVELQISFDAKVSTLRGVFGARSAAASGNISVNLTREGDLVADFGNHGSDYATYRSSLNITERTVYTVTLTKSGTSIVGGGQSARAATGWSDTAFMTPGNAYLFGLNGTSWENAETRFYGCTVKDASGTVIHRYVPVLEAGVPSIYDETAKAILAPSGTGALSYDAETYDVRLPYVKMTAGLAVDCGLESMAGLTATRTFRALSVDGVGAKTTETTTLDELVWSDQQLSSLQIFDGETLVRELVPAVKDGVLRLYDRMTRRFATVTGGELTTDCGVPYDKKLDFINNYGKVVYDLGYPLSSDMTIVYKVGHLGGSGIYGLFGARDAAGSRNISVNLVLDNDTATLVGDFNNSEYGPYRVSVTLADNKGYTVTLSRAGVKISDESETWTAQSAWTGEAFTTLQNAYLFRINGATFSDAQIRFYGCTVRDAHGIVIHDYIPVVKGGIGMIYDTVDGEMLGSLTDGALTAPEQTCLTAEAVKDAHGVAEAFTVSDADGKCYAYGVYVVADKEDRGGAPRQAWLNS